MGVLKTFGSAFTLTCLTATAALSEQSLLDRVTECVGRLSAQMEHHWLLSDQPTTRIERNRAYLIEILDTMVTPDIETRILAARIDAKIAHASLLTQAAFGSDPRRARWAERRVQSAIAQCDDILLPNAPQTPAPRVTEDADPADLVNQKAWNASQ
jgi:hypothetical protein